MGGVCACANGASAMMAIVVNVVRIMEAPSERAERSPGFEAGFWLDLQFPVLL